MATYFGFDVHKRFTQVAVVTEEGKTIANIRVDNSLERFKEVLDMGEGEKKVVMEAGPNWYSFVDMLEDEVDDLCLAHPLKTKAIAEAKIKTDKIDAQTLAQLLRADLIPKAYIPKREIRDLREHLRFRMSLVRMKTTLKNKVHSILDKNGIKLDETDIFGVGGRKKMGELNLRYPYGECMYSYLKYIDTLDGEIFMIDKGIRKEVKMNAQTMLLKSIPGIGDIIALLLYYEIGDVNRFRRVKNICSYAGLVPSVYCTGGKTRLGHITKQGNRWIRWAMIEAAQICARSDRYKMKRFFNHLLQRHGKKIATVALARKLLGVAYQLLKQNKLFDKNEIRSGHPVEISRVQVLEPCL